MKQIILPSLVVAILCGPGNSPAEEQPLSVQRIDPPCWWTGMATNRLQLMIYGTLLDSITARFVSGGPSVVDVQCTTNPSYAFLDIVIPPATAPGSYDLIISRRSQSIRIAYQLLQRDAQQGAHAGFGVEDAIYLIVPDRFANGDTTNDMVPGLSEGVDRHQPYGRHGGDLAGIIEKLDYLADLGVTALWILPLTENSGRSSYHGYAVTDHYRIDPRFGSNALYADVVRRAHRKGLKVIMDHVNNHIGINHPWVANLPMADWLNGTVDNHQGAYHGKAGLSDPHTPLPLKDHVRRGWFSDGMPDLNQQNPFVARYLIQNTIWWIEYAGIDGIREDTYPYIDPAFASAWASAITTEYPSCTIVGEVWITDPAYLAMYQGGSRLASLPDSHLFSVTDFGFYRAVRDAFADSGSVSSVYDCLAEDFLYPSPGHLLTFLDNHDIPRIAYRVGGDTRKLTLALTLLFTTRGIPQMLYGTEIGMIGDRDHGRLRSDFPGGFPGDKRDAFVRGGRTEVEESVFQTVKQLLRLRGNHPALTRGTLVHLPPERNVYTYFRCAPDDTVMVVINNSDSSCVPSVTGSFLQGAFVLHDLMNREDVKGRSNHDTVVPARRAGVFRVQREGGSEP